MSKEIYLIRHGLTESNKENIYAGWSDESLCQEGANSIKNIGKKLEHLRIEKIFSSPIKRAVQTADILNEFLNITVEIEENFKEMKMGPWEGLSEVEVAEKFPVEWKIWNSKPSNLRLDGRETLKEIQIRALKGIKKISDYSDCLRILTVTHVALIRVLIIYYNKLSMDNYRKIEVPNSAVYLLDNKLQKKKIMRIL